MKNGITKRGSTYSYVIRVPDPKTGKTKPQWVGGFENEQDAKLARDKARVKLAQREYVNPSKMSLEDFLDQWINSYAGTLKPRTVESYRDLIQRYINPKLGKMRLSQIRPSHIQNLYTELIKCGGVDDGPLSSRTVSYAGAILKKALKYAVDVDGLLPSNPASKVPLPRGVSQKNEPFTPNQMKLFLEAVVNHRLFALYRLAVYSGARKGELLALEWTDLDFENSIMKVSKNRVVINGKAVIQHSTKGGEGRRSIHLDPETMNILAQYRRTQMLERLKAGQEWQNSNLIFLNEFGSPIDYGTPTQHFAKTIKRLNLPSQRFHDLRHFHATQLLRAGTPLHVVAQRLGHRDAMVTATTYAHVTPDQAENAATIFAKAIG